MPFIRALAVAVILLTAGAFAVPKSGAVDRGEMLITPELGVVSKSFPAIPAAKPATPVTPFANVRPYGCRSANGTYCDAVEFKFEIEPTYRKAYEVEFELNYVRGITNNDMQLWLWPEAEDPVSGAPYDGCGSTGSAKTGVDPPKSCVLGEPLEPITATVVNVSGTNSGYTLTMRWREIDVSLPPGLNTGGSNVSSRTTPKPKATPSRPSAFIHTTYSTPVPTPRSIRRPGDDAEGGDFALDPVDAGKISVDDYEKRKRGGIDWVTTTAVGILLGSGAVVGTLAFRRRRAGW